MSLFEPIFEALNRAQVRYVVVGGFATVLHGHARLTADIDLVIDLSPEEVRKALDTLTGLGFRPRAPVEPLAFADPATRHQWIHDKGMRVFSMWDPASPMREVDLFVEHPIDFDELWNRSEIINLSHTVVRIASIPDLIRLKRRVEMPDDRDRETLPDDWGAGWEAHRVHQLTFALRATPAQRLAWLEEMIVLAYQVGALPKPRD